jgi:hypothetical protein
MMKRSGFKPRTSWPGGRGPRTAPPATVAIIKPPLLRAGPEFRYGSQTAAPFNPQPKTEPLQHEGYMALVRKLTCARCGIPGYSQFCHSDEGKGMGIKSDCRLGWPGCGPHPLLTGATDPGCHWLVGTSGQLTQEQRRAFEDEAAYCTRRLVRAMGLWPATLPAWKDEE